MKKVISLFSLVVLFFLVACGGEEDNTAGVDEASASDSDVATDDVGSESEETNKTEEEEESITEEEVAEQTAELKQSAEASPYDHIFSIIEVDELSSPGYKTVIDLTEYEFQEQYLGEAFTDFEFDYYDLINRDQVANGSFDFDVIEEDGRTTIYFTQTSGGMQLYRSVAENGVWVERDQEVLNFPLGGRPGAIAVYGDAVYFKYDGIGYRGDASGDVKDFGEVRDFKAFQTADGRDGVIYSVSSKENYLEVAGEERVEIEEVPTEVQGGVYYPDTKDFFFNKYWQDGATNGFYLKRINMETMEWLYEGPERKNTGNHISGMYGNELGVAAVASNRARYHTQELILYDYNLNGNQRAPITGGEWFQKVRITDDGYGIISVWNVYPYQDKTGLSVNRFILPGIYD